MRPRVSPSRLLQLEAGAALILLAVAVHARRADLLGMLALALGTLLGAAALIGSIRVEDQPIAGWLWARARLRRAARRRAGGGGGGGHRAAGRSAAGGANAHAGAPGSGRMIGEVPRELFGPLSVELFPASRHIDVATVHRGSTWTIALALRDRRVVDVMWAEVLTDLASLLRINGTPLTAARLHAATSDVPASIDRHLLLSLDAMDAADAIAARGGSAAAVGHILRRVVLRAQDVLGSRGIATTPLDEDGIRALVRSSIHDAAVPHEFIVSEGIAGNRPAYYALSARPHAWPLVEQWDAITLGGSRTTTIALGGPARAALQFAQDLAAPGFGLLRSSMLVATRRGGRDRFVLLARTRDASSATFDGIRAAAARAGVRLDMLAGRQRAGLVMASPAGMPEPAAWRGPFDALPTRVALMPPRPDRPMSASGAANGSAAAGPA